MRRDQFSRYSQYFFRYLKHMTFAKVFNLLLIEGKLLRNNPRLKGLFPHSLNVEISDKCNLSCPLCQMGLRQTIHRTNQMNLENYRKLISPVKKYLFQVLLYNWGEPFLNKDIYDIITFNTQNNIGSVVSSNFNTPVDAERLVSCGLEYLIISGDGVTQDIYGKYRRGGDINKVFNNLQSLVEEKRKRKSKFPIIEWQCLVTRFNEHQLDTLKKTVLEKGVTRVRFANINFFSTGQSEVVQKEWLPKNYRYRSFASEKNREKKVRGIRKPCFWLWRGGVVNVNGGLTPCCLYDVDDWGNAFENGFAAAWNSEIFQEARNRSQNDSSLKKRDIVCDRCTAPFIYK